MVRKDGITPPIHVFEKNLKNKVKKKNQKTKLCIIYRIILLHMVYEKKCQKKKKKKKERAHERNKTIKKIF